MNRHDNYESLLTLMTFVVFGWYGLLCRKWGYATTRAALVAVTYDHKIIKDGHQEKEYNHFNDRPLIEAVTNKLIFKTITSQGPWRILGSQPNLPLKPSLKQGSISANPLPSLSFSPNSLINPAPMFELLSQHHSISWMIVREQRRPWISVSCDIVILGISRRMTRTFLK